MLQPIVQLISPRLESPPRNIWEFLFLADMNTLDIDKSSCCKASINDLGFWWCVPIT